MLGRVADCQLSGDRVFVYYRIAGTEAEACEKARIIAVEQTVEFPADLIPPGLIHEKVIGRIESIQKTDRGGYLAGISYSVEITAFELTQLLNVVFGNSSIKPGIRVEGIEMPESLLGRFEGPRFGRSGLRNLLGIPGRPLLCTALKPMGLSSGALADLAYTFAANGIDIIKDDHGLTDQCFAGYRERVESCSEAVLRANKETGGKAIYMPNITGPVDDILPRARLARNAGAGGLLIAPGLVGFDAVRRIAGDDSIGMPVFSHPALQGSFVVSPDSGISHGVLFGLLPRLCGADATIYPNVGGRFSFSADECREITAHTGTAFGHIRSIFPCPGGGMDIGRVPEMLDIYGRDVIFLIGGGLFSRGPDLAENCRFFHRLAETYPV